MYTYISIETLDNTRLHEIRKFITIRIDDNSMFLTLNDADTAQELFYTEG